MIDFVTFMLDYGYDYYWDVYSKVDKENETRYPLVSETKIKHCIQLPNNDIMLGFEDEEYGFIEYYVLSEIELVSRKELKE